MLTDESLFLALLGGIVAFLPFAVVALWQFHVANRPRRRKSRLANRYSRR